MRDKEMRQGNITAHGFNIYIDQTLISLSNILMNSALLRNQSCLKHEYINFLQYINESLNKN